MHTLQPVNRQLWLNLTLQNKKKCAHHLWACYNTHNRFTALFPGPPRWAGARTELLGLYGARKINRGRHTDHLAGCHCIRTKQCPPPSPHFFTGQMLFLPPSQQCQSTEGNYRIRIREKTLEFSSTVLPAPSPYLVTNCSEIALNFGVISWDTCSSR